MLDVVVFLLLRHVAGELRIRHLGYKIFEPFNVRVADAAVDIGVRSLFAVW